MVGFYARGEVKEELDRTVGINERMYEVFMLDVAGLSIIGLFDKANNNGIHVGMKFEVDHCWLTNCTGESKNIIGLLIPSYTVIQDEKFEPMTNLSVRVNGRYFKVEDFQEPKRVGPNHIMCMSGKLRVKNEIGELFNVPVVGMRKEAYLLAEAKDKSFYNITGTLKHRTDRPKRFKIYVDSLEEAVKKEV